MEQIYMTVRGSRQTVDVHLPSALVSAASVSSSARVNQMTPPSATGTPRKVLNGLW